jgi:hypothetical protein
MSKVVWFVSMSLDGFTSGPNGHLRFGVAPGARGVEQAVYETSEGGRR